VKTLDAKKQAKIQQALAEGQRRIAEYQAAGQSMGSMSAEPHEYELPRGPAEIDGVVRSAQELAEWIGTRKPAAGAATQRPPARREDRMQLAARSYWASVASRKGAPT
jgi:hypothetical protein